MIEIWIRPVTRGERYANHLDRVISGPEYALGMPGRRYAKTFNPLLWVNSEAREAALSFYLVHLPFPRGDGPDGAQGLLYLSPEYDVVMAQPVRYYDQDRENVHTSLVDFLHDVKAYDPKHLGVTHLALNKDRFPLRLTPEMLHHTAAASFAEILQSSLRSLLCIMSFKGSMRGIGQALHPDNLRYHVAQTFPFGPRYPSVENFDWFDADLRWGVEFDLGYVPVGEAPTDPYIDWQEMETAFGIATPRHDSFPFYLCP